MLPTHFRQAHWMHARLHILVRVLVLCFALCTVALAGHVHQGGTESHHSCELCTGFGGAINPPQSTACIIPLSLTDVPVAAPVVRIIVARALSTAQARAPPSC